VSRLEHRIRTLDTTLERARAELGRTTKEAAAARARHGAPFSHEQRLATLRVRQTEIESALLPDPAVDPPVATVDAPPGRPGPDTGGQQRVAEARAAAVAADAVLASTPRLPAARVAALEEAVNVRDLMVQANALRDPPLWLRADVAARVASHP
jgi:hypothetical protein